MRRVIPPAAQAAFTRHHGLATRAHLMDAGLGPHEIGLGLREGSWVRVRRGVFCEAETWTGADAYRGRPLLAARAAVLDMRRGWVLSHDSAAAAHGLDLVAPEAPLVHVTRPGWTNAWTKHGVKHHLARFAPAQLVEAAGVPALDLARTAVDMAREHPEVVGLSACDAALRAGVSRAALWEAKAPMLNWPYSRRMSWCIENADAGAANGFESAGRAFVIGLGIGVPDTQFPLQLSGKTRFCDVRVGCHIFEFHGRLKYQAPDAGGIARAAAADVLLEERKRERLIAAEGLGVSNLYREDLYPDRVAETRRRVLADWQVTVARFGTVLPDHLARNAAEIRARVA